MFLVLALPEDPLGPLQEGAHFVSPCLQQGHFEVGIIRSPNQILGTVRSPTQILGTVNKDKLFRSPALCRVLFR